MPDSLLNRQRKSSVNTSPQQHPPLGAHAGYHANATGNLHQSQSKKFCAAICEPLRYPRAMCRPIVLTVLGTMDAIFASFVHLAIPRP